MHDISDAQISCRQYKQACVFSRSFVNISILDEPLSRIEAKSFEIIKIASHTVRKPYELMEINSFHRMKHGFEKFNTLEEGLEMYRFCGQYELVKFGNATVYSLSTIFIAIYRHLLIRSDFGELWENLIYAKNSNLSFEVQITKFHNRTKNVRKFCCSNCQIRYRTKNVRIFMPK